MGIQHIVLFTSLSRVRLLFWILARLHPVCIVTHRQHSSTALLKSMFTVHAKFRYDWDKTTSGFEKRTAAILEFYFRFWFRPVHCHRHAVLHLPAKFHPFFSRWRPAAISDLIWVMLDHPRSAIVGISLVLKFGLDPIYSFGDIVTFIFCRFGLKLPIYALFGGHISPTCGHSSF